MKDGSEITAYKNLSTNMAWDYDCHGYSIASGEFWVDNQDMQSWLGNQSLLVKTPFGTKGSVVVYRVGGQVQHSTVITGSGTVTMAAGTVIYPGPSKTTTVPIGEGWTAPGTTREYWRPK
ncbi:hypothetical protein [Gynuella sunshinyii]|uniref:hypothetical protein n=1 Tax=Gynuella sunshinyii TaxID=1445505 RepID=UPI0005CC0E89|nr:hypothetical protein [Gynuella sunshinyii]